MGANIILQTGGLSAKDMLAMIVGTEPFSLTAEDLVGLTEVADGAFEGCTTLTSIVLPDGVTSIGSRAFYGCSNLEAINIPSSVVSIGEDAFTGCDKLESPNLTYDYNSSTQSYTVKSGWNRDSVVFIPAYHENKPVTVLGDWSNFNTTLKYINLPSTLTTIGECAFQNCAALQYITLPNNLTTIKRDAFSGCSALQKITIPNNVTVLSDGIFHSCTSLSDVILHNNITTLGRRVFSNCTSLTELTIPQSVTSIGEYIFNGCTHLEHITTPFIGSSLDEFDNSNYQYPLGYWFYPYSYSDATYVQSYVRYIASDGQIRTGQYDAYIPLSLQSITFTGQHIYNNACYNCSMLQSITFTENVRHIHSSAFAYCNGLTSVYLPDSITDVDDNAFNSCINLESIRMSSNINTFGSGLQVCSKLQYNTYNYISYLGNETNSYIVAIKSDTLDIVLNKDCTLLSRDFLNSHPDSNSINVENNSVRYNAINNCLIDTNIHCIVLGCQQSIIPTDNNITSIGDGAFRSITLPATLVIPPNIETIEENAFYSCYGLENLTLQGAVHIGQYAFASISSLLSVTIYDSITTIDNYAFRSNNITSITYTNSSGTATLSGWLSTNVFYLMLDGNWSNRQLYINNDEVTGLITIPNDITDIPDLAFCGLKSITGVSMHNNVRSVGDSTFRSCSNLTSLTLSNTLQTIDQYAFCGCGFTTLQLPNSVTEIGQRAFAGCAQLSSLTLPNNLSILNDYVFYGCTSLTSATIPDSVTNIGYYTFGRCTALSSVTLGANIETMGGAFQESGLTSIIIPNNVRQMSSTFRECTHLTNVTLGTGLSDWQGAFFGCSGLQSITIPEGIETISYHAFCACNNLQSVVIPSSIKWLDNTAFERCTQLSNVTLPLTVYDEIKAFAGTPWYNSLTSETVDNIDYIDNVAIGIHDTTLQPQTITLKNDAVAIATSAFQNCSYLKTINMPETLYAIGRYAFAGTSIENIAIPTNITLLKYNVLYTCTSLTTITIPSTVTEMADGAIDQCYYVNRINYGGSITSWCNIKRGNNLSYGNYSNTIELYCNGSKITGDITITGDATAIGTYALYKCDGLTSITINSGVISIGERAFDTCRSLISCYMPNTLESIGNYAFNNCSSLTNCILPNSIQSIGIGVFDSCSSLSYNTYNNARYIGSTSNDYLYLSSGLNNNIVSCDISSQCKIISNTAFGNSALLESVTGCDNVTTIQSWAFDYCESLLSIYLGGLVNSIGSYSFRGCKSLSDIYYNNTKAAWNSIDFGDSWNYNTGNYTVHCTDGDIVKA